jgi:CBS domain containing-hemolysin-like protein
LIIALTIIVSLHVIIGEMVPKNAAVANPDRAAMLLAPPLVIVARVLNPIIAALNWIANCIVRMLGVEPRNEVASAFTADEVQSIVERSSAEGTLDDASGLLTGALEFSEHAAEDVMVPLAQVVSASSGVTVEALEALAVRTGFSRFPVLDGDAFIGYLHIKDTLFARPSEREEAIHPWRVRDLPVVAASDEVEDVLVLMRRSGAHVALVVADERPVGLVFLEDIIEELVGEVSGTL